MMGNQRWKQGPVVHRGAGSGSYVAMHRAQGRFGTVGEGLEQVVYGGSTMMSMAVFKAAQEG
jgi:hypothetical protein